MSTALYRRYRPDTFDEVIGQEHVTKPLKAALRTGKVTHAYLFSGPRGCGKTTSARIMARCLNCAQGPTDTPCGTCQSCIDLATGGGGSLDVVEIDAASHNGVDDARELRERAAFAPVRDRYKIYILDEAHMVTTQGFNALLKLVEEPPEHVKFIFATTEPDKVIGTIRSRTHHYPFRLVPPDTLEHFLADICARENVPVGDGVLPLVVRAGAGSVRDSLSVLDQLLAGVDGGELTYRESVALLGYTDAAILDDMVDAIAAKDAGAVFRIIERMIDSGHDPRRFVEDLLQRLRDLVIVALAGQDAPSALHGIPSDQLERMRVQAQNWGAAQLSYAASQTNDALTDMRGATSPRLQVELLASRLLLGAAAEVPARPVAHSGDSAQAHAGTRTPAPAEASTLRRGSGASAPHDAPQSFAKTAPSSMPQTVAQHRSGEAASAGLASEEGAVRPQQPAAASQTESMSETVRRRWPEILDKLRHLAKATWVLAQDMQAGDIRDGVLTLVTDKTGYVKAMSQQRAQEAIARAVYEVTGVNVSIHAALPGQTPMMEEAAGPHDAPGNPSGSRPGQPQGAAYAAPPSFPDPVPWADSAPRASQHGEPSTGFGKADEGVAPAGSAPSADSGHAANSGPFADSGHEADNIAAADSAAQSEPAPPADQPADPIEEAPPRFDGLPSHATRPRAEDSADFFKAFAKEGHAPVAPVSPVAPVAPEPPSNVTPFPGVSMPGRSTSPDPLADTPDAPPSQTDSSPRNSASRASGLASGLASGAPGDIPPDPQPEAYPDTPPDDDLLADPEAPLPDDADIDPEELLQESTNVDAAQVQRAQTESGVVLAQRILGGTIIDED